MTQMGADGRVGAQALQRDTPDHRDPQTREIIGAAIEVHNELGPGFLEPVYQEALAIELRRRSIPFVREVDTPIRYKGERLTCPYRADFVCYEAVILELKAQRALSSADHSQVINYLKATGFERALLLNFGANRLEFKRFILSPSNEPALA